MRRSRRTALLGAAWWLPLPLLPALLVQGWWVRRRIPRWPEASGPRHGEIPGPDPVRLVLLGESTAAGVGVADHRDGLAGQLAAELARRTGRGVRWEVHGRTGRNARQVRAEQATVLAPDDLPTVVVLAIGVNDVLEARRPTPFAADLARLAATVRERLGEVPVLFAGMAPLGSFRSLPQPMRWVLGWWARLLAQAATSVPDLRYVTVLVELPGDGLALAEDGFHPSAAGYRTWAHHLGAPLAELLPAYGSPEEDTDRPEPGLRSHG